MPDPDDSSTTALILAGGQASRMGGEDKGLLHCAGRPLIVHVLARIAPRVDAVLISANRNLEQYRRYGYPVIEDASADFPGPLAGIARGLEQCPTEWLWVVPCDAPLVDTRLLERLLNACRAQKTPAAVPVDAAHVQATFALLHRDVRGSLCAFLERGKRSVRDWLKTLPAAEVDCADHPEWFINLNTPEELAACAARLVDTAL